MSLSNWGVEDRNLNRRLRIGAALLALVVLGGCYDHRPGNPVDRYHYEHAIAVSSDYSSASIQTYVNRTHLLVGFLREDLYDGDRDGELKTPGMDRVMITNYNDVEDPISASERRKGEIRDYEKLFREIISAAKSGKDSFKIEEREYRIRLISGNLADSDVRLG